MDCPRCGNVRPPTHALCCVECGAVYDRQELRTVHLTGPAGLSQRVERFLATGDPDYTDTRIPVARTDAVQ